MSKDKNSQDHIRYDILVQEALRGVVRKVLGEVEKTGLPGDHHFFISFITTAPGVRISQRLLDQYEHEMTIVIQNQYWDFKVSDTGFQVGLSFNNQNELLEIPFSAIKGIFDPSVQFGLQFDVEQDQDEAKNVEKETIADEGDNNVSNILAKTKKPKRRKKETSTKLRENKTTARLARSSKNKQTSNNGDNEKNNSDGDKIISLDSFRKKT